jgi:hypothetical protein
MASAPVSADSLRQGHRALAAEVVEDLALARRIKQGGHRLRYLLGLDALDLRKYSDFASLWEGWTKNWLLGLALAGIGLQLLLRLWIRRQFQLPITFWWLMGAGGLVVGAIGPVSVWRTLSGRGWTWKGRPLA